METSTRTQRVCLYMVESAVHRKVELIIAARAEALAPSGATA